MRGVLRVASSRPPKMQPLLPFSHGAFIYLGVALFRSGERACLHLGQAVAVTLLWLCLFPALRSSLAFSFGEFVHSEGWRASRSGANCAITRIEF
jgi:hypothetical protein